MKNLKNLSGRRTAEAPAVSSGQKSSRQEEIGKGVANHGRMVPPCHDSLHAVEVSKPEVSWYADAVIVLPEQFFRAGNKSFAIWTGERRLLLAVLEEAMVSFLRYRNSTSRRGQRLFHETVEWFWSPDQSWLYSFETICLHLGLDAEYLREGLQRLHVTEADEKMFAFFLQTARSSRPTYRSFASAA